MNTPAGYGSAILSPCGLYRYSLTRQWSEGAKQILWIMLNPSTADANVNDPTIRRCIAFSKAWGYDSLEVVNLFALRSPNPQDLIDSSEAGIDPVGPNNDGYISWAVKQSASVIAAWGSRGFARTRVPLIKSICGRIDCLGVTKDGSPRHPLYVKADQQRDIWQGAVE